MSRSVTIVGNAVYKDGSPISGARIRIWEMDKKSADDLIVNDTTDRNGRFSGSGVWKDGGGLIDTPTYRYEITFNGKRKTGKNILDKKFFKKLQTGWLSPEQEEKKEEKANVTIAGTLIFKDKSAVAGARVRIWEMDKNSADDLIVNDTTDRNGRFSGTGRWKDGGGIIDTPTYRYEVSLDGEVISGKNILDKSFFKKFQTGWFSPAQHLEKRIEGVVGFKDKTPAKGVRVRVWETDNLRPNDSDDLMVDMITRKDGKFYSEKAPGKDGFGAKTFRWEVSIPGTDFVQRSKHTELPRHELNKIRLDINLPGWKNWLDDLSTFIDDEFSFKPTNEESLLNAIERSVNSNKKIRVVGSGHSHSFVAKPFRNEALIDLHKMQSRSIDDLGNYTWLKNNAVDQLRTQNSNFSFSDELDLVRIKAGTQLRTLYRDVLATAGKGLINIGPFDGQNIAGLVNTNTHGTGIKLPGFTDMVQSMEMFVIVPRDENVNDIEHWVIEPTNGISDPDKFKNEKNGKFLVQNDEVFHSAVCGYGLFGIVSSYTIAVRDNYWLNEEAESTDWERLQNMMDNISSSNLPRLLEQNHQVKIYINTAQCISERGLRNDTLVRIDTRNEVPYREKEDDYADGFFDIHKIWPPMKKRDGKFFAQKIMEPNMDPEKLSGDDIKKTELFALKKGFMNLERHTEFLNDQTASAYYRVIRRGRDNTLEVDDSLTPSQARIDNTSAKKDPVPQDFGPSIELSAPIEETIPLIRSFMNKIAEINVKFIGPVGVRFTKGSNHYLSPTQGRDSVFIEVAGLLPSKNMGTIHMANGAGNHKVDAKYEWPAYMDVYHEAMDEIFNSLKDEINGVRFHKGKHNLYNHKLLRKHYPDTFDKWLKMYHLFSASELLDCPNSVNKWKLTETRPNVSKAQLGRQLDALKTV